MKAKLIKERDWYDLYRIDEDGKKVTFASTQDYKQKLSLKNCQAIDHGYDLDELVEEHFGKPTEQELNNISEFGYALYTSNVFEYKKGFQKALELMGDKKFTEEDLDKAIEYGHESKMPFNEDWYDNFIQSLQQNEWEVEVEMEEVSIGDKYTPDPKPKLDADGCLILKRV